MSEYNHIKDLEGRTPIGAAVTIGVKHKQKGYPTQTDRWHIVQPREADGIRALHPAFAVFNSAPVEKRTILRGNLVHATRAECFEHHLKAQVLKGAHPNKKPACIGDGAHATRWEGGDPEEFLQIRCLNAQCEYRQTTPPKCKPFMRVLFRLRWPEGNPLPTPTVKFTSGSWNTTANFLGFFEDIEKAARNLGLQQYSLFGMPFILSLHRQTNAAKRTSFPVVTISSETDIIDFFRMQAQGISLIQQIQAPVALTDQSQQDPAVIYGDGDMTHTGNINVPGGKS